MAKIWTPKLGSEVRYDVKSMICKVVRDFRELGISNSDACEFCNVELS